MRCCSFGARASLAIDAWHSSQENCLFDEISSIIKYLTGSLSGSLAGVAFIPVLNASDSLRQSCISVHCGEKEGPRARAYFCLDPDAFPIT